MNHFDEKFDIIVIGAGHAGCEAAHAAARIGAKTAVVTFNLDLVAQMSCNPAIGGIAKGHLVREIDALGGLMGRTIDATGIQYRLLNRSRGPAVQAPRAQADRALYRREMRRELEELDLRMKAAEQRMDRIEAETKTLRREVGAIKANLGKRRASKRSTV